MNWIHALIKRARQRPRTATTPSGLIASVDSELNAEARAYLLASIIGRQPHEVLVGLHGPAVAPPSPVNRFLELGEHCTCWQYGGTCCSCRQGDCPANLGYQTRQFRRSEYEGRWTAPDGPSERRAEELGHRARERRRFSERPRIDPFPSRRGTW